MTQITNLDTSTTYTFHLISNFVWTTQTGITQMPIPTQQVPLLLNFGGAWPEIQINWTITDSQNSTGSAQGDFQQLVTYFASGDSLLGGFNSGGYTLVMPEVGSTITVSGCVNNLQLTYVGGQSDIYTCSMTFYVGTVV